MPNISEQIETLKNEKREVENLVLILIPYLSESEVEDIRGNLRIVATKLQYMYQIQVAERDHNNVSTISRAHDQALTILDFVLQDLRNYLLLYKREFFASEIIPDTLQMIYQARNNINSLISMPQFM